VQCGDVDFEYIDLRFYHYGYSKTLDINGFEFEEAAEQPNASEQV
jgi:hypothetical protein